MIQEEVMVEMEDGEEKQGHIVVGDICTCCHDSIVSPVFWFARAQQVQKLIDERPDLVEQNPLGVGRQGVSLTILRPSGKARFEDQIVDVVTQGPYVQPNTPIEIVESRGNRIVVREQDPSASSTS